MLFPLKKTCVKPGTVMIETVLSGNSLYYVFYSILTKIKKSSSQENSPFLDKNVTKIDAYEMIYM